MNSFRPLTMAVKAHRIMLSPLRLPKLAPRSSGILASRNFAGINYKMAAAAPIFNQIHRTYSTKTAPPPPPPPPHDKNSKGKAILDRMQRAVTFSLSGVLVIGAAGVAMLVLYLLFAELFLPSGDTKTFNKAVKLVESNEQARELLQLEKYERVRAYGAGPSGKWVRNRPVQSVRMKGKDGKDRLVMQFHVESNAGKHGTVSLEQIDQSYWSSEFAYIALDIPRSKRIYIIEPKFQAKNYVPKLDKESGFLGVKWGPKKD